MTALSQSREEPNNIFLEVNRTELVEKYTAYVHGIARKIKRTLSSQIELDDLISYGMTGLFEAANRFDPSRGANFTTFSYYRIRGAIYDGLRGMGWVSRTEYQKIKFGERANTYLESMANVASPRHQPELDELAAQVGQLITIFITSLDSAHEDDLEDRGQVRQDKLFEEKELRGVLKEAIGKLPAKDSELIELYYFKDLSLEEAGKRMGLSKSWTCRRHAQVVDKLSKLMRDLIHKTPVESHKSPLKLTG